MGCGSGNALTLERSRLSDDNKLLLYQAKTGHPVYVPLPPDIAEALRALPPGARPNPLYFFWSGNGLPKTAVADWQRSYRRLFELAGIKKANGSLKRCHPQMFRDTFAVEMLLAGVPLEQVSMLLGHKSIRVVEALCAVGSRPAGTVGAQCSAGLGKQDCADRSWEKGTQGSRTLRPIT